MQSDQNAVLVAFVKLKGASSPSDYLSRLWMGFNIIVFFLSWKALASKTNSSALQMHWEREDMKTLQNFQ